MNTLRVIVSLALVLGIYAPRPPTDIPLDSTCDNYRNRYRKQPNIIYIMADDLGWNDVGFHNPKVNTPNLDSLRAKGMELTQSYVQSICSPSRSAFVTGKYPSNNGLGLFVIFDNSQTCLPTEHKTIFEYMKDEEYSTFYVGKWHLGHCNETCMPVNRGIDEFRGVLPGDVDYFNWTNTGLMGRWINDQPNNDNVGRHMTVQDALDVKELITSTKRSKDPFFMWITPTAPHAPLQVTDEQYNAHDFLDETDPDQKVRREYLGLVSALDDLVGTTMAALRKANKHRNTIIIFTSDNGGEAIPTIFPGFAAYANNYPLRNGKYSFTEGGVRTPTVYYDPRLHPSTRGTERDFLVHITDWLPTFVQLGSKTPNTTPKFKIPGGDGVSQVANLGSTYNNPVERKYNIREEMLVALSSLDSTDFACGTNDSAIRWRDYKLIYANTYYATDPDMIPSEWVIPAESPELPGITGDTCKVTIDGETVSRCLFNVVDDPSEQVNLYNQKPELVEELLMKLEGYKQMSVKPTFNPSLGVSNLTAREWNGILIPRTDYCNPTIHSPLVPNDPSCF